MDRTYMVYMVMGAQQYIDSIYKQIRPWSYLAANIPIESLLLVPYKGYIPDQYIEYADSLKM